MKNTTAPEPASAVPQRSGLERIKAGARPILALLAAVFVGVAAWDLKRRWQPGRVEIDYTFVAFSCLPLLVGVLVLALSWTSLLGQMSGVKIPRLAGMALHIESQAARYTPGKVGVPLVRMLGAGPLGTTGRIALSSVFIELLCWVAVGGTFGFGLLLLTGDLAQGASEALGAWALPILACFALGLLLLLALDRRLIPERVRTLIQIDGKGPLVPARLPLMHALYWLMWAAHGYLISRSIQVPPGEALASSGVYVLAPIMGFLALAAPGGLGVREAVLSMALSASVGPAAALYAALLSRASSVLVDFGVWLASRPFRARATQAPS
jgi:hypothetical protein